MISLIFQADGAVAAPLSALHFAFIHRKRGGGGGGGVLRAELICPT